MDSGTVGQLSHLLGVGEDQFVFAAFGAAYALGYTFAGVRPRPR